MKAELISLAKKGLAMANENSPTILTGLAIVGVIGIVAATIKVTPKAVKLLEEKDKQIKELEEKKAAEEIDESTYKKEKTTVLVHTGFELAKTYAPVAIIGVGTVSAVIGANKINLKRLATVTSLYSASDKALKEWKDKTLETVGKTKTAEINGKVHDDILAEHPVNRSNVIITGKGGTLCYDVMSGRYFESDIEFIRRKMNDFNFSLIHEYAMSLNEFYEMLGLDSNRLGENVGWTSNNPMEIKFDSRLASDGRPCLVLDYAVGPLYSYRDY